MANIRVFISSVQAEFAEERKKLCDYIRQDALLGKFFRPFIFEELPAIDLSAQEAYLTEAAQCDIYLGICGERYGYEDAEGVSPTEREFDTACETHRHRLVFIKQVPERHPKEQAFVRKVEQHVVRKSFVTYDELRNAVYASLVRYMEEKELLRLLPWDAAYHPTATLSDIDPEKVRTFVDLAKEKRGFKIPYTETNIPKILTHLDLLSAEGRLTNSALLLFAHNPQRFFPTSEIKCMVFPTHIKSKPVLSYQTFKGNVFELVDAAVGFVMEHIDAAVGEHDNISTEVKYEIPVKAVTELIVNSVAHRTYESNGSVEVAIYRDRLEVWNPGQLPYGMTTAMLSRLHNSIPTNPMLATPMYLAGYIERMGTGTTDVVDACVKAGLVMPKFEQDENFRAIIWRKNVTQNVTQSNVDNQGDIKNVPQNVTQNVAQNVAQSKQAIRYIKIMNTLLTNRRTPLQEIAEILGVSKRTINRDLNVIRQSYRIEWIGSPKTGRWEIEKL